MQDWKEVRGSQKERPEELDTESSSEVVYLRRNIRQEERNDFGEPTKEWAYEEKEMTREEYSSMMIMKEASEEIVKEVNSFRKNEVIDEYTMQLVEEGIL